MSKPLTEEQRQKRREYLKKYFKEHPMARRQWDEKHRERKRETDREWGKRNRGPLTIMEFLLREIMNERSRQEAEQGEDTDGDTECTECKEGNKV